MKTRPFRLTIFLVLSLAVNIYSQTRSLSIDQLDPRFTLSIESRWSGMTDSEDYLFYVQNNTSHEYKIVVSVTLNINCVGTKTFKLGTNYIVHLQPHDKFTPNGDWLHRYSIKSDKEEQKKCLFKVGDTYTLFNGLRWSLSGIEDVTEKKEKEKKDKEDKNNTNPNSSLNNQNSSTSGGTNNSSDAGKPCPPLGFTTVNDWSTHSIQLFWLSTDVNTMNPVTYEFKGDRLPDNFIINYRKQGNSSWEVINTNGYGAHYIKGLEPCTIYEIKLQRDCGNGKKSPFSKIVTHKTHCGQKPVRSPENATQPSSGNSKNSENQVKPNGQGNSPSVGSNNQNQSSKTSKGTENISQNLTQAQLDEQFFKNQNANTAKYNEKIANVGKETEAFMNSVNGAINSYYAAQRTSDAKNTLRSNSNLSGNYNTVQELEAEFNQKYSEVNTNVEQLKQTQNQEIMTNYNNMNSAYSDKPNMQAAGAIITGVAYLVNEAAAERERKEAQARLETQKKEAQAAFIAKKKALRLSLRKTVLAEFPEGGVPLSSHKVETKELHFFAYIFQASTIENNAPVIQVSNVFPIAQYSDGTWPFKTSLVNDISKSSKGGKTTLVGYYTTKELAEQMRSSFIRMAQKSEFVTEDFTFKGKPSKSGSGADVDYWGNSANGATSQPNNGNSKKNVQYDEWGNEIKGNSKPTETNTPNKPTQPKKAVQYDEWGNPK